MAATKTRPIASFFLIGPTSADYVTFPEGLGLTEELSRYGDDWTAYVRLLDQRGPLLTGKPAEVIAALDSLRVVAS